VKEIQRALSRWNELAEKDGFPVLYFSEQEIPESFKGVKAICGISVQQKDLPELDTILMHKETAIRHKKQWFTEETYVITLPIPEEGKETYTLSEVAVVELKAAEVVKELLSIYHRFMLEKVVDDCLSGESDKNEV
jgi:hypothetical protein